MDGAEAPSAGWDALGESYYERREVYALDWQERGAGEEFDLRSCRVAAAPFAGAVAVTLDEEKFQVYRGTKSQRGLVRIYDLAGRLLRDVRWENVTIRSIGWTEDERLVMVSQQGQVRLYDLLGNFSQFLLLADDEAKSVVDCRYVDNGFVARLDDNTFLRVDSVSEPRPIELPASHIQADSDIQCWGVLSAIFTQSQTLEVLVSTGETVILLDGLDSQDQNVSSGPFAAISPSPNGQFLALMTHDGRVLVASSDFSRVFIEHTVEAAIGTSQVCWCGSDAVLLSDGSGIKVLGPGSETIDYFYDGGVAMISEPDGARILSATSSDFLRRVPDTLVRIFAPGSTSAASILVEAEEQLENRSAKADESVRAIEAQLTEAVDDCIKGANEALEVNLQKRLLRAASFGKGFVDLYNSDEFVDTAERLRVLNAVGQSDIALPITTEEYVRLTPESLVDRLLSRRLHFLASKICDHFRIPSDRVYRHWACLKIQQGVESDEDLARIITAKLANLKQIRYVDVARTAFVEGRVSLATDLLKHERKSAEQVPLLLEMHEDDAALKCAVAACDPDLLEQVISQLKTRHQLAQFFNMIGRHPLAVQALEEYAAAHDPQLIQDFYYQDDRRLDGAMAVLREALHPDTSAGAPDTKLVNRVKLAQKMLADGGSSKEHAHDLRVIDEHVRLLHLQEQLGKEYERDFSNASVLDLLLQLHIMGHSSRANKVAAAFKVSETTHAWITVRGFVDARDWAHLEIWLSRQKKLPMPAEQVAALAANAGNRKLALAVATRATDAATRIETLLRLDDPLGAAKEAIRQRDPAALARAKAAATGADAEEIRKLIAAQAGR